MLREALMAVTEMKARQERLLEEARVARMVFQARQTEPTVKISAYVFVSACQPKRVAFALRRLPGVLKADALSGTSEALLVVERGDLEGLQRLLNTVQSIPGVNKVSVKFAA
jgi:hypothetical protein